MSQTLNEDEHLRAQILEVLYQTGKGHSGIPVAEKILAGLTHDSNDFSRAVQYQTNEGFVEVRGIGANIHLVLTHAGLKEVERMRRAA
jgi:hypothetical protein